MFQMMSPGVDYNLTVNKTDNKMTVLVMPKVNGLKDAAQTHLVPFSLSGAPDEIDRGFFAAVQQPLQRAGGLLTNMSQFEKQADKTAANSKATKEAKSKEDKETKEKKERYDKHIKKAGEQEIAGNLSEAMTSLQQARLSAGEKDLKTVDEKIAALRGKMSQGSLFEVETVAPQPAQEQLQTAAQQPPQPEIQQPQQQVQQAPAPQPGQYQQPFPGNGSQQPPQMQPGFFQPQPQYPPQYSGQQPYYQQVPPAGGAYDPAAAPMQAGQVFNPADYAGMPDVHMTHVGEIMSNQQQV